MTNKLEFYRCDICGNLIQVLNSGEGQLVCCGKFMEKLEPKVNDNVAEKHVPVFLKSDGNRSVVQIGSELHPMEDAHYITFIETISDDKKHIELGFLNPGEKPQFMFCNDFKTAYEFCNVHGLWKAEKQ